MRRAVLALGLLLLAMVAFGPRATVDPRAPAAAARALPAGLGELEEAIARFEAQAGPVTPGAEARVVWAEGARERRSWSVVYLHGFSATRQETAPLAERVAEALGAHLFEARFTGHGLSGAALAEATGEAWLADARTAFAIGERLGERTLVLATSTGATLAWLAAATRDAPGVAGFVFLSPNFGPRDGASKLLLWPWAHIWVPLAVGAERSWEPANEAQARFWTTSYPIEALFPMMAVVAAARDADPSAIEAPARVFVNPEDEVVSPAATRELLERAAAPVEISEVEGPGDDHVLAGDILSPARTGTIAEDIVRFARSLAPSSP